MFLRAALAGALLALHAAPALAQNYSEPARGTELRADLMSALRPIAEWELGAPVEFVVNDLRVAGDVALARLYAQRPGGGEIDLYTTPMVRRGEDPSYFDGPSVEALLVRSGRMWVAVDHVIGPTDAWYAWEEFCPVWHSVLPELCG